MTATGKYRHWVGTESCVVQSRMGVWEFGMLDVIISRPPAFTVYQHGNTHPFSSRRAKEHNIEPKFFVTSVCLLRQLLRLSEFQDRTTN